MPSPTPILVAPAWPYASGPRHLGHVVGFGVPADIFARYQRLKGNRVLMVSGTDEHGTPVMVAADNERVSPREIADRYNAHILDDLAALGLTYDTFTRTTTKNHYRVVQDVFQTLYERGYILERTTMGAFSATTGHTLPDRYVEGTCPHCGYPNARGDQCDNCGRQLDPIDLVDPRARTDGLAPVFRETKHLFLDLPAFAAQLSQLIERQRHWRPNVRNFSLQFVNELQARPITRDLDWGVPVPVEGWREEANKRIYVWFDAVIGYLSASVEWAHNRGEPDAWRDWWQNEASRHYYFMGKDNIVFHTVIWPGMLLGHNGEGDHGGTVGPLGELRLPDEVVSSEYLTMSGSKFSTSRGKVIYVGDFLHDFGPDALRYFIAVAGPETTDTDFTWDEFVRRTNFELANEWGNLVNRAISMAYKNNGAIPSPNTLLDIDHDLLRTSREAFDTVGALLGRNRFKLAITEAMRVVGAANKYISDTEPWKLAGDPERRDTVLHTALQVVSDANTLLTPFLPHAAQQVHQALGGTGVWAAQPEIREVSEEGGSDYPVIMGDYANEQARWESHPITPGAPLQRPTPLFTKIDEKLGETGPQWAPIER